jgi:phenylacetate-CoA ligase
MRMKPAFARLARRFIRWKLARITPEQLLRVSERKVLRSFQRAAKQSPAYRTLLAEAGVDPVRIRTASDFVERCPILEKSNTFRRFRIDELISRDVPARIIASILTSSGYGSGGFALGLSTRAQLIATPWNLDLGLDLAFDVDRHRTLLINCLPMGVTFQSNTVCVANVSVREDMACAIVEQAGGLFEQIILCGDPLFLKRLCDFSESRGIDWGRHRMHAIVGEETFGESFRDYLAGTLHIDPDAPAGSLIGSSMGVGELGLNLFYETRETIALRRACARDRNNLARLLGNDDAADPLPTFLAFNPQRTFVEVNAPDRNGCGDLLVSVLDPAAVIPLMRYKTGDRATLIDPARVAGIPGIGKPAPFPMIALQGRAKDLIAPGWHVDTFKDALYRRRDVARHLTGAFRLSRPQGGLQWELQLVRGCEADPEEVASALKALVAGRQGGGNLAVVCYAYHLFPYGQTLDFERKFIYWAD